jgi:hypothetical protein
MQLLNIPVEIAGDTNENKERRGTSWASATRTAPEASDRGGWGK